MKVTIGGGMLIRNANRTSLPTADTEKIATLRPITFSIAGRADFVRCGCSCSTNLGSTSPDYDYYPDYLHISITDVMRCVTDAQQTVTDA